MDGTEHQGLMLVMNSPAVPDQEADWNRWHNEEHRPAILGSGFFTAADRFEVFGKAQAPSETRYLSLYQTPRADADQAQVDMAKANAAHRAEPRPPSVRALIGTYTKLSEFGAPDRPRAGSIVLVMTDCVDPAAEADSTSGTTRSTSTRSWPTANTPVAPATRRSTPSPGRRSIWWSTRIPTTTRDNRGVRFRRHSARRRRRCASGATSPTAG